MDKDSPQNHCAFVEVCYLADCLNCFGYKQDCPLFTTTHDGSLTSDDFHKAIDDLIQRTRVSYLDRK